MRQKMHLLISFSSGLIAAAWYLVKRAVFQPQRSELAAPDAAAIERCEARAQLESQCRPVAANERRFFFRPQFEPRAVALRRCASLGLKIHLAVGRGKTHARH